MSAISPALGEKSFTCPHCGAIAHQTWFRTFAKLCEKDKPPFWPDGIAVDAPANVQAYASKIWEGKVFRETYSESEYLKSELINLSASLCYSCSEWAIWIGNRLVFPDFKIEVMPNLEMPPDVRADFLEANEIVEKSPRGAAALLRLSVQKLMKHLGETGENINADIASLVQKGLDPRIQKALDVVRVVGNNAVHPGQIELTDDRATAMKLFGLVNLIVEDRIEKPKHIDELFETVVPASAKEQISKRDKDRKD